VIDEQEYLAIERAAELRSEFLDGEMIARQPSSLQHGRVQSNILGELHSALRGSESEALGSDLRIRASHRMYAYPDGLVLRGKPHLFDKHEDVLLNPAVIFEILSPSTETYDRGVKFQHYRTIASLKDYILVAQDSVRVEHYTRSVDNTWTLHDHQTLEEELKIASIGISLPLSRIYDRVELPPAA
jgi:Uma2 family endonuclease